MKKIWQKTKSFLFDGFLFIMIYELLEEIMEDLIAAFITNIFLNLLSKVFYITAVQAIKYSVKKVIKVLTQREGDDKMKLLKKLTYILYFNKCTIIMALLTGFSAYSAYVIIPLSKLFNILIGSGILVIGVFASINIGWENYNEIIERLAKNKARKAEKKVLREKKKAEKNIFKEAKLKEKEIKKVAKKIKKEKIMEIKLKKKESLANMRVNLLDQAMKEYEKQINENKNIENNIEKSNNV